MISISPKCNEPFNCTVCNKEIPKDSTKVKDDDILKCYPCYLDSIHFPDMMDETWKSCYQHENLYIYSKNSTRKSKGSDVDIEYFEALKITDSFYYRYSGYKVIWIKSSFFTHKQIKGYRSVEQAKIEWNLKHCSKKDKPKWVEIAKAYNKKSMPQNSNNNT